MASVMLRVLAATWALLAGMAHVAPAFAQQSAQQTTQPLRLGYLRTYAMLPLYQAVEKGYFRAHGLEVELNVLNNGPAVAASVQSGSLDVGYAATIPIAAARSRGQDFRFFAAAAYQSETRPITMYVASNRAKVNSFADIAGKTVAVNAAGGCVVVIVVVIRRIELFPP